MFGLWGGTNWEQTHLERLFTGSPPMGSVTAAAPCHFPPAMNRYCPKFGDGARQMPIHKPGGLAPRKVGVSKPSLSGGVTSGPQCKLRKQ